MTYVRLSIALLALCWVLPAAHAQSTLLDLNQNPGPQDGDSDPAGFVMVGSEAFFRARSVTHGTELWRTTGVPGSADTVRLTDIAPGPGDADPRFLTEFQGALYFAASDGATGRELWRLPLSGGAGAQRITDLAPGGASSFPRELTVAGPTLFFVADAPNLGSELFAIDAAAPTTIRLVRDIDAGAGSSNPYYLTPFGNRVLFSATLPSRGREPWISDGTSAGTTRLRDIGSRAIGSGPGDFVVDGNRAFFVATDATAGREIWSTDGTSAGTNLWLDVAPGTASSSPAELTLLRSLTGTSLAFAATASSTGREVFVTPTANPAPTVVDLRPGATGSNPALLRTYGTEVVFAADDGQGARLLQFFNVNTGARRSIAFDLLGSRIPDIDQVVVSGSQIYCSYDDNSLFVTNGTAAGTDALRVFQPVGEIAPFPGDRILLAAAWGDFGIEPHVADPTTLTPLADLNPGSGTRASEPRDFTPLPTDVLDGSAVVASADDGVHGRELVTLVGSTGSRSVTDIRPGPEGSFPSHFLRTRDEIWFVADDGTHGAEIWRTRGDAASTSLVLDFAPGAADSGIEALFPYGDRVCFLTSRPLAGLTLWITDGTPASTSQLAVVHAAPSTTFRLQVEAFETGTGFLAVVENLSTMTSDPVTVIQSDGTAAGTSLHRDALTGSLDGAGLVGNRLVYKLSGRSSLFSIWHRVVAFDPAADNLTTLHNSTLSVFARGQVEAGRMFFLGEHPSLGEEPWSTSGTTSSTRAFVDVAPGPANSVPGVSGPTTDRVATAAADGIWWCALDDGVNGIELWRSDGTSSRTWRVSNLGPGTAEFEIGALTPVGSTRDLLFGGDGELCAADDTPNSARLLQDIRPGIDRSDPSGFTTSGGWVYFSADDGTHGREAWALPLTAVGAPNLTIYGQSCSLRSGPLLAADSQPTLGNTGFGIRLGPVPPNQPAVLRFGIEATRIPLPGGCTMLTSEIVSIGTTTGPRGSVRVAVPLPNDPNLLGASLYVQAAFGEASGPLFGGLGLSAGLQMVIGD